MIRSKRVVIMMLVFLVIGSVGAVAPATVAAGGLSDIESSWAYNQINFLVGKGIITGYVDGTFKPDNPVSRAEFCVMINRAFGLTETVAVKFSDVKPGDWFYADIAKARAAGYIYGMPDGSMRPDSSITRQEASAILARVMNLDIPGDVTLAFSDASSIPWWSRSSIAALANAGFISGYPDGSFRPLDKIGRAETAAILFKAVSARIGVADVSLDRTDLSMRIGDMVTLVATIVPADAYNKKVTWTSSDQETAVVDSNGTVTALAYGTSTITVTTADGGYTADCRINVAREGVIDKISLSKDSIQIMEGGSYRLVPDILPAGLDYPRLVWISDDQEVATVGDDGLVTAQGKKDDTCDIIVSSEKNRKIDADCTVEIIPFDSEAIVKAEEILLSQDNITLDVDQYFQLWARIEPDDTFNQEIYWSSDKPGTATVNSDGLVKGRSEGSCTIRAYWENDNSLFAECEVNVEPAYGEVVLGDDSLVLAPGQHERIQGSFRKIYFKLADVKWELKGDNVVDVELEPFSNYFIAQITAKGDAKDGEQCTITFTVTDTAKNEYESACRIRIRE